MDYRYEVPAEARDFHRRRKAFIIINGELEFLPDNTPMSHYEYCIIKGIDKQTFNELTRGYFINGRVIFYKDNLTYDDALIEEALSHLDEIASELRLTEFEIIFGQLVDQDFAYDYCYGQYVNGEILKNDLSLSKTRTR